MIRKCLEISPRSIWTEGDNQCYNQGMISLEKSSALPLQLRDDFSLVFGEGLPEVEPEIREFSSLKSYLKNPSSSSSRRDIYHIYRDVTLLEDHEKIREEGLEYDLTVIPPGKIGDEFAKTAGHYHSLKSGATVRYPEVYEVIFGKVFWLIQSASEDFERLEQVYLFSARRGEKLVVPPRFGHVSINSGEDALVLANWRARDMEMIYEPYENHNGAAYYVIQSGRLSRTGETLAEFEFVPNLNYKFVPELTRVKTRDLPQYDLRQALPMYFTGTKDLRTLDFLINPENYLDELRPEKLFGGANFSKI